MRKHSARKWLHFCLDLLPIFIIPIYAIFTINHDVSEETTVITPTNVYYDTNEVSSASDLVVGNVYHFEANVSDYTEVRGRAFMSEYWVLQNTPTPNSTSTPYNLPYFYFYEYGLGIVFEEENNTYYYPFNVSLSLDFVYKQDANEILNPLITFFSPCNTLYLKEVIDITTIYPNDVGSALINSLYTTVEHYFNFNNVFNFGDIYHWFELNMFGGNAPMPIFIVWNIIVYQFLMDLMFLVYSIFMFIIDFADECLARCFSFSRHGGSR